MRSAAVPPSRPLRERRLAAPRGSSAPPGPSRWLRTLPWLAGLLLGTTAHIVWWTQVRDSPPCEAAERAPSEVTVHVHERPRTVVHHVDHGSALPSTTEQASATPPPLLGARGAVVCQLGRCTLRRSFVRRLLHDPGLVGTGTRLVPAYDGGTIVGLKVFGVFPGGLADLLGLVDGDTIVAIDDQPIDSFDRVLERVRGSAETDRITLTLEHADMVRTMRYRVIDG